VLSKLPIRRVTAQIMGVGDSGTKDSWGEREGGTTSPGAVIEDRGGSRCSVCKDARVRRVCSQAWKRRGGRSLKKKR
jgi:hypothetical protein